MKIYKEVSTGQMFFGEYRVHPDGLIQVLRYGNNGDPTVPVVWASKRMPDRYEAETIREMAEKEAIPVKFSIRKNRGYTGGHNSVATFWPELLAPAPPPVAGIDLVMWWDTSSSGVFSGYWPENTAIVRILPDRG